MTEYYRGMLMACNQLKTAGYTIHVQAWNADANTDIEQVLQREGVEKCNVIFGPLYSKQVKPLADYCKSRRIRLVIPFSITGNEVALNLYVFQVYQDGVRLTSAAVNAFLELRSASATPCLSIAMIALILKEHSRQLCESNWI